MDNFEFFELKKSSRVLNQGLEGLKVGVVNGGSAR
jgi:hypothetical protein